MAKNIWFADTFLQSLFDKYGVNNSVWLSQKQTAICIDNMEKIIVRRNENETHFNYKYIWDGRLVSLSYSKKNACGQVSFGINAEEQEKEDAENKANRDNKYTRFFISRPEELKKELVKLNSIIADREDWIAECIEVGDAKEVARTEEELKEYYKKINLLNNL
jgi:hypothetical protein